MLGMGQGFSSLVGWIISRDSLGLGTGSTTSKMSHWSFILALSFTFTTYMVWRSWWSHARKLPGRPFRMSKVAPPSKYFTMASLLVLLALAMASSRIRMPTYSPQAWLSGGLP